MTVACRTSGVVFALLASLSLVSGCEDKRQYVVVGKGGRSDRVPIRSAKMMVRNGEPVVVIDLGRLSDWLTTKGGVRGPAERLSDPPGEQYILLLSQQNVGEDTKRKHSATLLAQSRGTVGREPIESAKGDIAFVGKPITAVRFNVNPLRLPL